jgi:hypothetical protein
MGYTEIEEDDPYRILIFIRRRVVVNTHNRNFGEDILPLRRNKSIFYDVIKSPNLSDIK